MEKTKNKSEAHRRRQLNQQQYAPRLRPAPPTTQLNQDPRLRKLTVDVLEELKRPDAVPSVVIYKALAAAAAGLG